eukprot:247202_1
MSTKELKLYIQQIMASSPTECCILININEFNNLAASDEEILKHLSTNENWQNIYTCSWGCKYRTIRRNNLESQSVYDASSSYKSFCDECGTGTKYCLCEMRICITCAKNICYWHAFIANTSDAINNTFCANCSGNSTNKIKLRYSLPNTLSDYSPTPMISALNHFLKRNNIQNALVIIQKFINKCPSFSNNSWSNVVYQFLNRNTCCHRGVKKLHLFRYLLYKEYNNIILCLIKLIKTLQISEQQKINIMRSFIGIILCYSCVNKQYEDLALKWLKECNLIYNNCIGNNHNLLLKEKIECSYDVHYIMEMEQKNNQHIGGSISLLPLDVIDKASKGQLYEILYHGRMGYYPQKIANYINSMTQNDNTMIDEKENKLNDDNKVEDINNNSMDAIFKDYFYLNFSCGSKTDG